MVTFVANDDDDDDGDDNSLCELCSVRVRYLNDKLSDKLKQFNVQFIIIKAFNLHVAYAQLAKR